VVASLHGPVPELLDDALELPTDETPVPLGTVSVGPVPVVGKVHAAANQVAALATHTTGASARRNAPRPVEPCRVMPPPS
jgi:hypothetical protein